MKHAENNPLHAQETKAPFDQIKEKQEIWQKIKDLLPEMRNGNSYSLYSTPIGLVFEASTEDGLNLAKQLGLTPKEIQQLTVRNTVWQHEKHKKLSRIVERKAKHIGVDVDEIKTFTTGNVEAMDAATYEHALEQTLKTKREEAESQPQAIQDLAAKIENYYSEFLPYRYESLEKKTQTPSPVSEMTDTEKFESRKAAHIRRAEDILFRKYMGGLSEKISKIPVEKQKDDEIKQMLTDMKIPENEQRDIQVALRRASLEYEKQVEDKSLEKKDPWEIDSEVFPILVINTRGTKREYNLHANRKPVNKIIEQMTKTELIRDIELMANTERNDPRLTIEKDPILGKYIPIREQQVFVKHELEEQKIKLEKYYPELDRFFDQQAPPKSDSVEDITEWLNKIVDTPEWNDYVKTMTSVDESKVPLNILFEEIEFSKNPHVKKFLQNLCIREAIDRGHLRGMSQFLIDLSSGKIPNDFTPEEVGNLFAHYENNLSVTSNRFDSKEKVEANKILEAVNTLEKPELESLAKYFTPKTDDELEHDRKEAKKEQKSIIGKRLSLWNFLRNAMKQKVSDILKTISAKKDGNIDMLADKIVKACYPEEYSNWENRKKEKEKSKSSEGVGETSMYGYGGNDGLYTPGGLTHDRYESNMSGGNPGSPEFKNGHKNQIATFDKEVSGMFVTNILGYDPVVGKWKRNYVPIDGDMMQGRATQKVTATMDGEIGRIIPAPLATSKIELTSKRYSEVQKDSLGLIHLEGSRDIQGWSYDVPIGEVVPEKVDENTYTRFLSRFVNENGALYLEKNPDLPIECKMFVDGIKTLPPRDRVIKIQEFVRNSSFYDAYDNPNRDQTNAAPFADRCTMMRDRLESLQEELGDQVPDGMMFAGVCADFAMITESMFREAGLASAVIEGYSMHNDIKIDSRSAHAKSGVFWPDHTGKTILAGIETTPPARTAEQLEAYETQGITPQLLTTEIEKAFVVDEKRAAEIEKNIQEIENSLNEEIHKFEQQLAQNAVLTIEQRKKIEEQVILLRASIAEYVQQTATLKDISVFKGVLEAIRYSPITKMDQNNIDDKIYGMKFIQGEYGRIQKEYEGREEPLERVSHLGRNFIGDLDAMVFNSHAAGEDKAFANYVGHIGEYGAQNIPENHKKVWGMLKTYMQAKLM